MPATDFRTNIKRLVRWAKLGLLGHPVVEVQRRRLAMLALAEVLGLSDEEMVGLRDHPLWNGTPIDLTASRVLLRDAKRTLAKPNVGTARED